MRGNRIFLTIFALLLIAPWFLAILWRSGDEGKEALPWWSFGLLGGLATVWLLTPVWGPQLGLPVGGPGESAAGEGSRGLKASLLTWGVNLVLFLFNLTVATLYGPGAERRTTLHRQFAEAGVKLREIGLTHPSHSRGPRPVKLASTAGTLAAAVARLRQLIVQTRADAVDAHLETALYTASATDGHKVLATSTHNAIPLK